MTCALMRRTISIAPTLTTVGRSITHTPMKCTAEAQPEWRCLCGSCQITEEFNQGIVSMIDAVERLNHRSRALAYALSFHLEDEPSPYWLDG